MNPYKGGKHKIISREKKINRLQCDLQESSLSKRGDRAVMSQATMEQLTQLLDEKIESLGNIGDKTQFLFQSLLISLRD